MPEFCGATLDSRLVKPGMLFVAVKGERVDGHDFIPQALAAGAARLSLVRLGLQGGGTSLADRKLGRAHLDAEALADDARQECAAAGEHRTDYQ